MSNDPPFDIYNRVDLDTTEAIHIDAVEEVAMHLDPESIVGILQEPAWSELTDEHEMVLDREVVRYFDDEQPETTEVGPVKRGDERALDLEELLQRQHYLFKTKSKARSGAARLV